MIDQTHAIHVPTFKTKPKTEIDISHMSEGELASLRRTDPFLHHSIPAVREANLSLKSVETKAAMIDQTHTIHAPTINTKPKTEIDISHMSEGELASLRRTDPLLYHSIPAVHEAKLSLRGVDPSHLVSKGSILETKATMIDQTHAILVPTFKTKPKTEIDISRMSEGELASLRQTDPFLYHSIPAVREADLSLRGVDPSHLASSLSSGASWAGSIVSRKSRVSTECHDSMLLESLPGDGELTSREFEPPRELAALFGDSFGSKREFEPPRELVALFSDSSDSKCKR